MNKLQVVFKNNEHFTYRHAYITVYASILTRVIFVGTKTVSRKSCKDFYTHRFYVILTVLMTFYAMLPRNWRTTDRSDQPLYCQIFSHQRNRRAAIRKNYRHKRIAFVAL
jgi:hypothetical protein